MFNLFKKSQTFDPIQRGSEAGRHASKLAQLVPFRYLLANASDGSVSFTQYTGVFVEQDKVHILNEEERAAVAGLLADMRRKNTPAKLAESSQATELHWLPWPGGECPVPPKTYVQVQLRDKTYNHAYAADFQWAHGGEWNDIIEYRVVSSEDQETDWRPWNG